MSQFFIPVEESSLDLETEYPIVEQFGPLRRYDKEMRCASRGCGSSTFFKVRNVPRCMIHALRELNEMLVALGVRE